jgi:hypothetical protein
MSSPGGNHIKPLKKPCGHIGEVPHCCKPPYLSVKPPTPAETLKDFSKVTSKQPKPEFLDELLPEPPPFDPEESFSVPEGEDDVVTREEHIKQLRGIRRQVVEGLSEIAKRCSNCGNSNGGFSLLTEKVRTTIERISDDWVSPEAVAELREKLSGLQTDVMAHKHDADVAEAERNEEHKLKLLCVKERDNLRATVEELVRKYDADYATLLAIKGCLGGRASGGLGESLVEEIRGALASVDIHREKASKLKLERDALITTLRILNDSPNELRSSLEDAIKGWDECKVLLTDSEKQRQGLALRLQAAEERGQKIEEASFSSDMVLRNNLAETEKALKGEMASVETVRAVLRMAKNEAKLAIEQRDHLSMQLIKDRKEAEAEIERVFNNGVETSHLLGDQCIALKKELAASHKDLAAIQRELTATTEQLNLVKALSTTSDEVARREHAEREAALVNQANDLVKRNQETWARMEEAQADRAAWGMPKDDVKRVLKLMEKAEICHPSDCGAVGAATKNEPGGCTCGLSEAFALLRHKADL